MTASRICSLLPSATEIVCALGLEDRLVGVTHECDYPASIENVPRVTSSTIDSTNLSSGQIDEAVRNSLAERATLYHLDPELMEEIHPDLVLTQSLCDVCAVGPDEVSQVIRGLSATPEVLSLEPRSIDDLLASILTVARAAGVEQRGEDLVRRLRERLAAVCAAVAGRSVVSTLTLEWIDPVFVGGHWVPEMVAIAGGRDALGCAGAPSRQATWDEVSRADPDTVIAMLCGFDLERTVREMRGTLWPGEWNGLRAVRDGRVFATDGSAYFSRPGPRLVDGVEILASILHPSAVTPARQGTTASLAADDRAAVVHASPK
ncbi:MAG: cobalamin-binding protein [Chloroflexota bacterium]